MTELIIGIVQLRSVGSHPRQRNTASVASLGAGRTRGAPCGRVLKLVPRNIGHFEQAEFLPLVHVCGAGQRHFHQDRRAGTLGAELTVLLERGAVTEQPIQRQTMVFARRNLWERVSGGMADHIMVAHDPGCGGTGASGAFESLLDRQVQIVADPVLLGEFEVEDLSEIVRRRVQMLSARAHPGLGHRERRRIVFVEDLAPFVVDVVHFVTVDHRMRAVLGLVIGAPDHIIVQIVAVEILGETVGHIHTEAVRSVVEPESQGLEEVVAHFAVVPVPVGLFLGEHVQIPLAVRYTGPGRTTEMVLPVGRRLVAVRPLAITEDVTVTLRRARFRGEGRLEPFVQVGAVVRNDVDHHFDAVGVRGLGKLVEVVDGSELRIDVAVVVDVIAAIRQLRRIERAQPDGVDAEFLQIIDLLGDACDLPQSFAFGILEGTRVDLIDHGLLPPQGRVTDFSHVYLLVYKRLHFIYVSTALYKTPLIY